MYKSILITLAALVVVASAVHLPETPEVVAGRKDALKRGLETFGGGEKPAVESYQSPPQTKKVYSLYTQGLESLDGGKPKLASQYAKHNYVPYAPSVVPVKHSTVPGTPEDAAARFKPEPAFQYTTDQLH